MADPRRGPRVSRRKPRAPSPLARGFPKGSLVDAQLFGRKFRGRVVGFDGRNLLIDANVHPLSIGQVPVEPMPPHFFHPIGVVRVPNQNARLVKR